MKKNKIYKLKNYERFQITGKGTVFSAHRDENDVEGIKKGSIVITEDDGNEYEVTAIEKFTTSFGESKVIGLLVKRIFTIEEICKLKGIEYHELKEGETSEWAQIVDRTEELNKEIGFYRLGRKQKRALLDKDGNEVAIFSKRYKDVAQELCTLLNLNQHKKVRRIIDEEFRGKPRGFPKEQPDGTD